MVSGGEEGVARKNVQLVGVGRIGECRIWTLRCKFDHTLPIGSGNKNVGYASCPHIRVWVRLGANGQAQICSFCGSVDVEHQRRNACGARSERYLCIHGINASFTY